MISYKQCEELVGVKPEYPVKNWKWRAYKDGNYEIFDNVKDASQYSSLVEKFLINEDEYTQKMKEYNAFDTKVRLIWLAKLKEEFGLPDKVFDVCYSEAYERGHSAGYDEIASYMYDVVEFYGKIMEAVKDE